MNAEGFRRKAILYQSIFFAATALLVLASLALVHFIGSQGLQVFKTESPADFVLGASWNQSTGQYWVLPLLYGSLMTTVITLFVSVPLAVLVALLMVEVPPPRIRRVIRSTVELFAASALELSGGQQQRLCIARTLASKPDVILMDEPASALDPIATLKIEDLMLGLAKRYTIVIATHNMQQAARVSDYTAFFNMGDDRAGYLVEYGPTNGIFTNPAKKITEDYITGRFG